MAEVHYDRAPPFEQSILYFDSSVALTPTVEVCRAFLEVLGAYFGQETITLPMKDLKDRELSTSTGKSVSTLHLASWSPDADYRELPTIVVKVEKSRMSPVGFNHFREGDTEGRHAWGSFLFLTATLYMATTTNDGLDSLSDGVAALLYDRTFWKKMAEYSVFPESLNLAWAAKASAKLAGVKQVYATSVTLPVYQEMSMEKEAAPYATTIAGEEVVDVSKQAYPIQGE